jgi:hypothetical protein
MNKYFQAKPRKKILKKKNKKKSSWNSSNTNRSRTQKIDQRERIHRFTKFSEKDKHEEGNFYF